VKDSSNEFFLMGRMIVKENSMGSGDRLNQKKTNRH